MNVCNTLLAQEGYVVAVAACEGELEAGEVVLVVGLGHPVAKGLVNDCVVDEADPAEEGARGRRGA